MKLALSIICILLLGLFGYQVSSFPLDSRSTQFDGSSENLIQPQNYELPKIVLLKDLNEYSSIIDRPLFTHNRKAAKPVSATTRTITNNDLSNLILVGTAISKEVEIGIIADTKLKKIERLKEGENYNEWEIASIEDDHIVFQNEDLEYKLFTTPIENKKIRRKAYQRHKIDQAKSKILSAYTNWERSAEPNLKSKKKTKLTGNLYYKKDKSSKESANDDGTDQEKTVRTSPIKIPIEEEEKDPEYYEALDEEEDINTANSSDNKPSVRDITADDFYEDEEITEEELKALEDLGAEIFLD